MQRMSADRTEIMSIDENICLACTYWDNCLRTYAICEQNMGYIHASLSWINEEDDFLSDEK